MQATLIENNGAGRIAYDSLILDNPKAFSALNSKLAFKIVKALANSPASAIDVSRKLKIHEQKIYYHVRRLEKAGIIYQISNERRHGMIAKIYSVVSPVIAAKLYEKGIELKENLPVEISKNTLNFFGPFTENSNNFTIVVGNPYPHGKYDTGGLDACYGIDLALFLGSLASHNGNIKNVLKLDTLVKEQDIRQNLILIGGPVTNSLILKVNSHLPVYFDENKNFSIVSHISKSTYNDESTGIIIKMPNPFEPSKTLLVLGGRRTRGTQAAVLAATKYFSDVFKNVKADEQIVKIVKGLDEDSDDFTDSVRVLE